MGIFGEEQSGGIQITKEDLQKLLETVIAAAKAPNAVEQRQMDKEEEAERRRLEMSLQMGKIEMEAQERKKSGCSHMRYVAGQRFAGHAAPRTGGQHPERQRDEFPGFH